MHNSNKDVSKEQSEIEQQIDHCRFRKQNFIEFFLKQSTF
jgi:hypothetical protein